LENLYLPPNRLLPLRISDLHLLVGLNRDLPILGSEDRHPHRRVRPLPDHLPHHVVLLELSRQVRGVTASAILLVVEGKRKPSQHFIELVINLQKFNAGVIPMQRRSLAPLVQVDHLRLQLCSLLRPAEKFVQVVLGHQVGLPRLKPVCIRFCSWRIWKNRSSKRRLG
jgi:hypothetical protein